MIRIDANRAEKRDSKYFFNGSLFSGILFFLQGDKVIKKKVCRDGLIIGDYENKLFSKNNYLEINFDALIGDDPYYPKYQYFDNKKFTGMAYGFNQDGFCIDEMLFIDGYDEPKSAMDFYPSGKVISFDKEEEGFSQLFEWYESGAIKQLYLTLSSKKDKIYFEITKLESGLLKALTIGRDYFENIEIFKKNSMFDIFEEKYFLEKVSANNDYLRLSGQGIDDEVFYYLYLNKGLANVKRAFIKNTSLTDESFERLVELHTLEELEITSLECSLEVAIKIKRENPNCKITLNTKEIT